MTRTLTYTLAPEYENPAVSRVGATQAPCNICGDAGMGEAFRYWDCDDGWTFGALCLSCYQYCRAPHDDDYASQDDDGWTEQTMDDIF
jgi:hypothetical protein